MILAAAHETLHAISTELARALKAHEGSAAQSLISATFPTPFDLPPLLGDDIAAFAGALERHPHDEGWWGWLVIDAARNVVGFVICSKPEGEGVAMIGWSTYPAWRGRGHAVCAARAIIDWAFATGQVKTIRATIPPSLEASLAVARRAGLSHVGRRSDPEVGELEVFETHSAGACAARPPEAR
jgi:RimJ/RimL family protein N-acetyltransferase